MRKKLWRTIGVYKAQFISMIIMITLGVGIFVGFNMEWYTVSENTSEFFEETKLSDYQIIDREGFSNEDVEKIKKIDGVDTCGRFVMMNTKVKDTDDTMALTVSENDEVSFFKLMEGEKYDEKSDDGVWISDKYAKENNLKIGDDITFVYNNMEFKGVIKGLIKSGEYAICLPDKTHILPDFQIHGFAYITPVMLEKTMGMTFYSQINVVSDLAKKELTAQVDDVMGKTMMVLSKEDNISYAGPKGEIEEGQTMAGVLPVLFLSIAVLIMVTTMGRIAAKEKVQIGTLKALGFKDRKILSHYASYSFTIGVIGSVIGIGIGYVIATTIMNPKDGMMTIYIDMPKWTIRTPGFCYIVLVVLLVVLTLIGYLSTRQMLKGTAADALRSYSPKKMKPMWIENTKLFEKLPFDIRWNMRDTARHKSRTFMSLLGTIGCVTIIISCLGMSDTVDIFYDNYYDGSMQYNSKIYVTDPEGLVEKYNGDTSAGLSVKVNEEPVALDIYNVDHDLVKFVNTDMEFFELKDDGAYICKRIAEENKLEVGDKFTVSPYGTDDEYDLKVAGIISSFKKGMVITDEYAEEIKLPYTVDAIYTSTEKKDVEMTDAISNVQTKDGMVEELTKLMEMMDSMVYVLLGVGLILGIVVLYNLGIMSYTERYRELATLKVLGFKDKRLANLMISQNIMMAVIGTVIGIPLGMWELTYLVDKLGSETEISVYISASSYLLTVGISLGVSLLVSMMLARKNKKIDMVEALKSAE